MVFWDVLPCRLIKSCIHFGGPFGLHFQDLAAQTRFTQESYWLLEFAVKLVKFMFCTLDIEISSVVPYQPTYI